MSKKINIGGYLIIALTLILLFIVGYIRITPNNPSNVYIVYLEGQKIGLLDDVESLYNLIDEEQENIKESFGVEKVYPPANLETIAYTTYQKEFKSAQTIYDIIEEKSTFTIKGYTVTIRPDEADPIYINILNKEDLEKSLNSAISAFISTDELNAYLQDNQMAITDTGKTINNVYFEEKITIKESYLSIDEEIITNEDDLTKYLLFGTLEAQAQYTVKEGDTVENVAYNNKLSNEELLIANPTLTSVNSILSKGQVLSIGLINPLFTVVEESEIVEDVEVAYGTVTESDSTLYDYQSYVKQEGKKGINHNTEIVQKKNGEIISLTVSNSTVISSPIEKIVVKGTKPSFMFNNIPPAASSTDWGWPTISPYVITSYFSWRWGRLHGGIDIAGSGFGSPIYSATDGTVLRVFKGCADKGYYGSSCGGGYGNYVEVLSKAGYTIYYAHMRSDITVAVGATITKGQKIGTMGSSGSSTGTHLHFEIRDQNGNKQNPCQVAFAC